MSNLDAETVVKTSWHALSAEDALEKLDGNRDGLTESEANERRSRFGPNELPEDDRPGIVRILLGQFKDPLVSVLLIATGVSLALGYFANAGFIGAVLVINAVVGALQEGRAEASASALKELVRIRARVRRDAEDCRLDARDLVPGDLVRLQSGDAVPADLRLLSSKGLEVDEAPLTGESTPVEKQADDSLDEDDVVSERTNMVFAGSTVMDGSAIGIVCRIGEGTQVGRIAESLAEGSAQEPPLVLKLRRLTRQIALFVLIAVIALGVIQFLQGSELERLFFLAVALAVSAIPAGLPIAITVAMALATRRMAQRNVIVRQLPAVEGLGSCTLIGSDKTGTLTENILTVRRLQLDDGQEWKVSGEGYDAEGDVESENDEPPEDDARDLIERIARAGFLCNEGRIEFDDDGDVETEGDSVDLAFLVLAAKLGAEREELTERYPEKEFIQFSAQRRYAASFNEVDGDVVAHVKGAAEAVIPMCRDVDEDELHEREETLADQGYRVLALAAGRVDASDDLDDEDLQSLDFLGFAALIDPIRSEVPDAIERCKSAGVEVRMITGDHPATGLAIARELGIADEQDEALTGADLRELEDDEDALAERIRKAPVFARVEPRQKTQIVEALQQADELVAVTGDGVNDAPALKTAHIGVAMGQEGTDVARRAASLILTDDNFASLVNGIEEGRGAYDNVRKVTWLLLATGAAEVLLFFLALLTGLPLPLTAVQLLWLNLVTNGIQDVALGSERVEPGTLQRKPRPPDEPIFNRRMIRQILISGLYMGTVAFVLFYMMVEIFALDTATARNLVLLQMVLFENVHAFSCRSETRSAFGLPIAANRMLFVAVAAAQGIHIAAMYTPGLKDVLGVSPVSATTWAMMLGAALSLLALDELAKWLHRRRQH